MSSAFKPFFNNIAVQLTIASTLILAYYFPYIYNGENSYITIHDNLDSNLSWVKILLDSGTMFSNPQNLVPQVFNGIPRSALYGNYDISLLWFYLFGMYEGYIFNKIIMSLVAFIGMHLLLNKHVLPRNSSSIIPFFVSLMFSLLPFWSFTLSVCGLPLISYAFMNLRNGKSGLYHWLIVIGFAFYSSLVLSGIFFMVIVFFILAYDWYRYKKINWLFLKGVLLLCGSYLLSHYPLIYSFLFKGDYTSHRVSFYFEPYFFSEGLDKFDQILRFGQYHAHSFHTYLIIPIIVVLILQLFKKELDKRYLYSIVFLLLTSFIYGFIRWEPLSGITELMTDFLPLQFQRFHFLHPMTWYILLALALWHLSKYGTIGKVLIWIILFFQIGYIGQELKVLDQPPNQPSYKEFYAESLFAEVKDFIGQPNSDYRVISLGMHPSIAQYNGFYTLDGYFPNYPLAHKLKFRKVIAPELEKNPSIKNYYDNWGSRCYAFNDALKMFFLRPKVKKIEKLDFNFNILKEMGGHYLLSTGEIDTSYTKSLQLEHVFEHQDSFWKIYLYRNLADSDTPKLCRTNSRFCQKTAKL